MRTPLKNELGKRLLFFDGGMGSELQRRGLAMGVCPEEWNIINPEAVAEVYRAYAEAGADVVTTNTFGGSRAKLTEFHLEARLDEINALGIEICRRALGDRVWIAASIGPTGKLMEPLGTLSFEQAYDIFAEQVSALAAAAPDLLIIETMSDILEVKAAVAAVKENCRLPFIVTMTFDQSGRTATGTTPESMAITIEPYGPLAVGANCGVGPKHMVPVIKRLAACTALPLIAQANAGIPRLIGTRTVFELSPDDYVKEIREIIEAGVALVGGCCGTTPQHISALLQAYRGALPRSTNPVSAVSLSSRSAVHRIGWGEPFTIVGERINPTGRKQLSKEIREGSLQTIIADAQSQEAAGAQVLDINVSAPGVDEPAVMKRAVIAVQNVVSTPLSIDSPNPLSLEAGCKIYAGRPLLNSVNGERAKLDRLLPIAKKYGTALICLTMDEQGLPHDTDQRLRIARRIMEAAVAVGLQPSDLIFDFLTLTAGSQPRQAWETLDAVMKIRGEFGVATILGVSNVSFGLPERPLLTSAFLAMAVGRGLDAAIVNPHQEKVREILSALEVLSLRDSGAARYIAYCSKHPSAPESRPATSQVSVQAATETSAPVTPGDKIFIGILNGDREGITALVQQGLQAGLSGESIVQDHLIAAMNEVGRRYEKGIFFLPQLIMSGETMQRAFEVVKPTLTAAEQSKAHAGVIVFATVEGDIHDIGKNIVSIVLRNNGFTVIDLGKDVPLDRIERAITEHKPNILALSSLMTTTLPSMSRAVELCKTKYPWIKTLVGGAVVNAHFAEQIGASGYARDAVSAGKKALELVR